MKTTNTQNKIKFSKNAKLNKALEAIYNDLQEFGAEEVKRYKKEFPHEKDFNLAQYGNLLCYYSQVREFYKNCGYISMNKWSDKRIWELYLQQVGYIARNYFK